MAKTLRARLFLLATLAVAPATTLIIYTAIQQQQLAAQTTSTDAHHLAKLIREKHEDLIEKSRHLLEALSKTSVVLTRDKSCGEFLSELIKVYPYYANIGVLDPKGHAFCSAVPISGPVDLSFRTYYQRAIESKSFSAGDYQVGKITGKSSVNFALPVYNQRKTLNAVLFVALDLGWLNKIHMGKGIPPGYTFLITDQNGVVLVKHPEDSLWVGKSLAGTELFNAISKNKKGTIKFDGFDQVAKIFAYSPLSERFNHSGLFFALGLKNDSAVAAANPLLGGQGMLVLFILLVTLLIIWFGSDVLVLDKVQSILAAIKRIKLGDFNARTGAKINRDEVSQLAAEFDDMASHLQAQIIERERAEEEIRKARDAADAASKAKSHFVAHMSHEIRTPIGAILGFSELLNEFESSDPNRTQYLKTIQRNADHLLQLVDGILDLSKIEAGAWEVKRDRFSLLTELTFLERTSRAQAALKKLDFKLSIIDAIPEFIESDELRLHQILTNLINNAIKFTEQGQIELKVRYLKKEDSANSGMIEFLICDTGKGMTSTQLEKIFEPFVQGDSSMGRTHGGAGLGLYLARHFAKSLGGEVGVLTSSPDSGSVFWAAVETGNVESSNFINSEKLIETAKTEKMPQPKAQPLKGFSILVIEDSRDNQFLLNRLLSSRGARVDFADNAEVGINKALSNFYDYILMDIQLPGMNGLDATQKLRSLGFKTPIIALTAHAMKGERERCLNAGCDEYSTKPIQINELVRIMLQLQNIPQPAVTVV